MNRVTAKELEVAEGIYDELLSKQIADKLGRTRASVESSRYQFMRKTGCRNVADVVKWVHRSRLNNSKESA